MLLGCFVSEVYFPQIVWKKISLLMAVIQRLGRLYACSQTMRRRSRRMNKLGKSEYVKYGYGMVGITVPIGVMVYY
jgi:hypothetical protein